MNTTDLELLVTEYHFVLMGEKEKDNTETPVPKLLPPVAATTHTYVALLQESTYSGCIQCIACEFSCDG